VTVAELEQDKVAQAGKGGKGKKAPKEEPENTANALGFTVSDLTPLQKKEMGLDGGAFVEATEGVAARAGLSQGDVVLQLNNIEVKDAKQFNAAAAKLDPKKGSTVLVRRGEVAQWISLRPISK